MERLMAIARKAADQVEVYSRIGTYDDVSFENAKLKDIDSKMVSGVALRIVKDGKLGTAYTRNLIDREGLVKNALATLSGGVEAGYQFPKTVPPSGLAAYDPAIETLTNTQMVDECRRVCSLLADSTQAQVNGSAARATVTIRVMNSAGTDLSIRMSEYGSYAAAMYPGSYSSVLRVLASKKFTPMPDSTLNYIRDTYNRSRQEVKVTSGRMKVLFLPESVYVLAWRLIEALSGKSIYEKVSPLKDRFGERIMSDQLTIVDEPLNDQWPKARSFDDEGTPCRNRPLVEAGVLKNFYCDLHYARKLGIASTGHGYRSEISSKVVPNLGHLFIRPGKKTFAELVRMMDRGIIASNPMGAHSGNILNGDFSVGLAPGLLVERGEIQGLVKGCMVAGNIYETMKNVVALEDTLYEGGMGRFPAILLDDVSVAV